MREDKKCVWIAEKWHLDYGPNAIFNKFRLTDSMFIEKYL